MTEQTLKLDVCPECGAAYPETGDRCWLCTAELPHAGGRPATAPTTGAFTAHGPWSFGLSSLMMLITLIAVCLGVAAAAPCLGIALAVVVTPALVRTFMASTRRKAQGQRLTMPEKVLAFWGSLGIVVLAGVAAGVAFFATCWIADGAASAVRGPQILIYDDIGPVAGPPSDQLEADLIAGFSVFFVGIIAAPVVGLIVGGLVLWWLWPTGKRKARK